ncbi:MAG: DUF1565 domain-containing protein [Candidatus Dojkabacteria bacterium]|nr:DUF1565 domain-containing protein [Candidatus Dojkabacteria bacterium]
MKIFTPITVLSLCAFTFALVSKADAATYYVSTSGDNGNDGSSGTPWRDIQHALDTMTGGDTLKIGAGTYSESVRVKNDLDGTVSARTIIEPWNSNDTLTITSDTSSNYVLRIESDYTLLLEI